MLDYLPLVVLLPVIVALGEDSGFLIPLRRETFKQVRGGKLVSRRSAYYGVVSLGSPVSQELSVVFDTGSGHVVVPGVDCKSPACLQRRQYDIAKSERAVRIQSDGYPVLDNEFGDEVTIGFGTGTMKGQLIREHVCLGSSAEHSLNNQSGWPRPPCSTMNIVTAVAMSDQPFKSFHFDGIFGLSLSGLTLGPEFSFLPQLARTHRSLSPRFGIFLGAEGAEGGEISIGGVNAARMAGPLVWEHVARPELGYWQVSIRSIRIGSHELQLCQSGTCRAVLDTGTSHLGAPTGQLQELRRHLTVEAPEGTTNCRRSAAPVVSIELHNLTITLTPEDYMLREPQSGPKSVSARRSSYTCRPALMPVNFQAPLGPDLFILGEPVLRRYYTVYNWQERSVGFGLADSGEKAAAATAEEEVVLLLQVTWTLTWGTA